MHCQSVIKFNWEIFYQLKYLSLKEVIFGKNEFLNNSINFKIVSLKITETGTKNIIYILKIFKNLVKLNLSKNFIDKFQSSVFIQNFLLLQNLDLSKNFIKFLDSFSFLHLKNLLFLNLNGNYLKKIKSFSFIHQMLLGELNISDNQEIVELDKKSFNNLKKLKIFHFQSKIFDHVTKYYFQELNSLREVSFLSDEFCCIIKKIKKNIKCSFKVGKIKFCTEIIINIFQKSLLLFFSFILFSFSIFEIIFSYKILNLNFRSIFINNISNILISFYIFLLFSHYVIQHLITENEEKHHFKSKLRNLPCYLAKYLYCLIIDFIFCLIIFNNLFDILKNILIFLKLVFLKLLFIIISLIFMEIFINQVKIIKMN